MTYILLLRDKLVSPTMERWFSIAAAERGKRYWERVTGMKLRVKGSR